MPLDTSDVSCLCASCCKASPALQALLRRHRIGTIAAEQRDTAQAEQYLSHSQQHFSKRLGDDNPITGEVRGALCLSLHWLVSSRSPLGQCRDTPKDWKARCKITGKANMLAKLQVYPGDVGELLHLWP